MRCGTNRPGARPKSKKFMTLDRFLRRMQLYRSISMEHLSLIQAVVKQHRAPTNARSLLAAAEVATKPARVRRGVRGGSRKSNK